MASVEPSEDEVHIGRRKGRTTIVLRRDERGRWQATQRGVDVAGHGETAAAAAAEYCRRVDEREE